VEIEYLIQNLVPQYYLALSQMLASFSPSFSSVHDEIYRILAKEPEHLKARLIYRSIYPKDFADFVPNVDIKLSTLAFSSTYQNASLPLEHFREYILKEMLWKNAAEQQRYHSLTTSVVQSSGYGKSRILLESGRNGLNVIYACLRMPGSTGYPVRNERLFNHLVAINDENKLANFLRCTFLHAVIELSNSRTPEAFAQFQHEEPKFESFWDGAIKFYSEISRSNGMADVRNSFDFIQNDMYKKLKDKPTMTRTSYELDVVGNVCLVPSELILVLDEASSLLAMKQSGGVKLSLFRNLRRAMRLIGSQNFVLVLVDTLSSVSEFSPPSVFDPSYRGAPGHEIFAPFYEVLTFDSCLSRGSKTKNLRARNLALLFAQGRPIWSAYFFNTEIADNFAMANVTDAVTFAKKKLSFSEEMALKTEESHNAVASVRFGITEIMDHSVASDLMSSYMATGVYIGKDRLRMVVHYPSEPVLSEAACRLIYQLNKEGSKFGMDSPAMLSQVLANFSSSWASGIIHAGDAGELLARILLSVAYDSAHFDDVNRNEKFFSDPVTVRSFLAHLISIEYQNKFKEEFGSKLFICDPKLISGTVAFTTFVKMAVFPGDGMSQSLLKRAFQLRTALMLRSNQPGVDVVIPVFLNDRDGYSYILVQVNNRDNMPLTERLIAAGYHLTPDNCFNGHHGLSSADLSSCYLALYMELGFEDIMWYSSTLRAKKPTGDLPAGVGASMTSGDLRSFHAEFPNHGMLLGNAYPFLSGPFEAVCRLIFRRQTDNVEMGKRSKVLSVMDPICYMYATNKCSCKKGCGGACGCPKSFTACSSRCGCSGACIRSLPALQKRNNQLGISELAMNLSLDD